MRKTHTFLLTTVCLLIGGIVMLFPITLSKCGLPDTSNFQKKVYISNPQKLKGVDYADTLDNYRKYNLQRLENIVYLDYAKESVFADSQMQEITNDFGTHLYGNTHSESPSATLSTEQVQQARAFLLNYLGISSLTEYITVFTYSHAQALKVIAESFPYTEKSKFFYPSSSSNNILGLRGFVEKKGGKSGLFDITKKENFTFEDNSTNVIAFPLVDEFTGEVLSVEKMKQIINTPKGSSNLTITLADASLYLANHKLDLKETPFTAIAVSFEKIFGFPNLGCAVISGDLIPKLQKPYFGGGTLVFAMPNEDYEKMRLKPSEKFEDGSIPFLSIASLKYGFDMLKQLGADETFHYQHDMGQRLYRGINEVVYEDQKKATIVYSPLESDSIVTFNVLDKNGNIIDYHQVLAAAKSANISLSGGCMSTPGSCYAALNVTEKEAEAKPEIGAIRASVGWATTMSDVDRLIQFLRDFIKS